jgi:hypothetical protein
MEAPVSASSAAVMLAHFTWKRATVLHDLRLGTWFGCESLRKAPAASWRHRWLGLCPAKPCELGLAFDYAATLEGRTFVAA